MIYNIVQSEQLFRAASNVVWNAEPDGILFTVTGERAHTGKLLYPEAAVWDFVVRGIGECRSATMIKHIAQFPDEAVALALVRRCVKEWLRQGLIVASS